MNNNDKEFKQIINDKINFKSDLLNEMQSNIDKSSDEIKKTLKDKKVNVLKISNSYGKQKRF